MPAPVVSVPSPVSSLNVEIGVNPALNTLFQHVNTMDVTRPGQRPSAFTIDLTGTPEGTTPIEGYHAGIVPATVSGLGRVLSLTNIPAVVAYRVPVAVSPVTDRAYRIGALVMRAVDPADPVGDTVRLGVEFLNGSYNHVSTAVLDSRALVIAQGAVELVGVIGHAGAYGTTVTIPGGAVYFRPFVQVFGSDNQTFIAQITCNDSTLAGLLEAVSDELAAEVVARETLAVSVTSRMGFLPTVERTPEIVVDPVSKTIIRQTLSNGRIVDGRGMLLLAESDLPTNKAQRVGVLNVERDPISVIDPVSQQVIWRTDRQGATHGDFRSPDGKPFLTAADIAVSDSYGLGSLWRTVEKRMGIQIGQATQLSISLLGDSWTGSRTYYAEALTNYLRGKFGDAGPGWAGFAASGSGAIAAGATTEIGMSRSGTWTDIYGMGASPDVGLAVSSSAGARYVVTGPAGLSALQLFANSGNLRYSWNSGTNWTALNITGNAVQVFDLTGLPAGAWTLWIEAVSGTVRLAGVNALKAGTGVRVNKLGKNGTHTAQMVAASEADFIAGHTALASDLIVLMHGTNDQWLSGAITSTPEVYEANVAEIVDRLRTAVPTADILLVTPPSTRVEGYPMADYSAAMRRVAISNQIAHIDLQARFGRDRAEYAYGSARALLDNTEIHPTTTGGRAVLTSAFAGAIERN